MRTTILAMLAAATLAGCGDDRPEGPPQVKYGRAECAECGMIVSQERYAAAIVLPKGEPERDRIFDDINCMVEYDVAKAPDSAARYVHDVQSLKWIPAGEAQFVRDPEVHTPMGSGLQAFSEAPSTMAKLTYDQLRAAVRPAATETAPGR